MHTDDSKSSLSIKNVQEPPTPTDTLEHTNTNAGKNNASIPKISVLMPVYNTCKEFLSEAISSILSQTVQDFELIIVNDGSTDDNVERVIRTFHDSRIVYLSKNNTGIADTLNYGWSFARGKYIARMDSDDIAMPQRFERQLEHFRMHPELSIVGTGVETFPKRRVLMPPKEVHLLDFCMGCVIAHPTVMIRKADLDKYGLRYRPEMVPAEDYDLWTRAAMHIRIGNVREVLLRYRRNPNGISSSMEREQVKRCAEIREQYFMKWISPEYASTFLKVIRRETIYEEKIYRVLRIPVMRIVTDAGTKKFFLFKRLLVSKVDTDIEVSAT